MYRCICITVRIGGFQSPFFIVIMNLNFLLTVYSFPHETDARDPEMEGFSINESRSGSVVMLYSCVLKPIYGIRKQRSSNVRKLLYKRGVWSSPMVPPSDNKADKRMAKPSIDDLARNPGTLLTYDTKILIVRRI